ncbi:AraC family ligand binding domain-containing protein [Aeromonas caviae]|uniref:AraC family ligand binding domain-containing protein n=1 Tax=Aeromonas caviae TaxID=648 RepID=UPI003C12FC2F
MPDYKKEISSPEEFDSDTFTQAAVALHVISSGEYSGINPHAHRKGQLIMSLHGAVSCEVQNALWLVPPGHAVWIPGDTPHSCRIKQNARTCFLFIEPGSAVMPETCCTIAITPPRSRAHSSSCRSGAFLSFRRKDGQTRICTFGTNS